MRISDWSSDVCSSDLAEAALTHVTVYCDGPRNQFDIPPVEAVRQYVDTREGFASVSVVRQPHNLCQAQPIINGGTQMLEQHEAVLAKANSLIDGQSVVSGRRWTVRLVQGGRRRY